jgi:hypothetical protein
VSEQQGRARVLEQAPASVRRSQSP